MNVAMRRAGVFGVSAVFGWLSFLAAIWAYETEAVFGAGATHGSSVALEVATRVETAGVVLCSPIDSVPLTADRWYGSMLPIAQLAKNRFDNRERATRVRVPVLVVHGSDDEWIPVSVARSLFELIPGPRLMVETHGGHNGAGFASHRELRDPLFRWWPPERT